MHQARRLGPLDRGMDLRSAHRQFKRDVGIGRPLWCIRAELQEYCDILWVKNRHNSILHSRFANSECRTSRILCQAASVMLRRQQAQAIIAARQKIVEGAVGMVEMALEMLSAKHVAELDEERKASMVSNLLVVLCSDRDAQPIVNAGTLYQ